jgi:hypothetical protein
MKLVPTHKRGSCTIPPMAVRRLRLRVWQFFPLLLACGGSAPQVTRSAESASEEPPSAHHGEDALAAVSSPGLGSRTSAAPSMARAPRAEEQAASATAAPPAGGAERSGRSVGVRGITGSLTAFEVEAAMNERRPGLLACVQKRPRSLGHVAGDIAFHLDVDGQGKVERVLVTRSDLGYPPLEDCLAAVVASAPLQPPAGAERAEAQWGMSVDPLSRPAEAIDSAELEPTIARHAEASYESCSIPKGRRFTVNGYLGRKRKLQPVSIRPVQRGPVKGEPDSPEQVTCLVHALEQWKGWPKGKGYAKVAFELRWVAAPPPQRRGRATRRHR